MKRNKTAAFLLILLAVTLIFSAAFIVENAGHTCHGQHCAVCQSISVCLELLHSVGLSMLGLLLCSMLAAQWHAAHDSVRRGFFAVQTPVSLRVKLSD